MKDRRLPLLTLGAALSLSVSAGVVACGGDDEQSREPEGHGESASPGNPEGTDPRPTSEPGGTGPRPGPGDRVRMVLALIELSQLGEGVHQGVVVAVG
ncbi:MAG: hypothetical protein ACK6CU_13195, partial [Deltaproteobacteria bacterium]